MRYLFQGHSKLKAAKFKTSSALRRELAVELRTPLLRDDFESGGLLNSAPGDDTSPSSVIQRAIIE